MTKELLQKIGSDCITDKVVILNAGSIGLSFTNIEQMLTITVLAFTAIYTGIKIYKILCENKEKIKKIKNKKKSGKS